MPSFDQHICHLLQIGAQRVGAEAPQSAEQIRPLLVGVVDDVSPRALCWVDQLGAAAQLPWQLARPPCAECTAIDNLSLAGGQ